MSHVVLRCDGAGFGFTRLSRWAGSLGLILGKGFTVVVGAWEFLGFERVWRLSVGLSRTNRASAGHSVGLAGGLGDFARERVLQAVSIGWPSRSAWPTGEIQSKCLRNRGLSDWLARLANGAQRAFHVCNRLRTENGWRGTRDPGFTLPPTGLEWNRSANFLPRWMKNPL